MTITVGDTLCIHVVIAHVKQTLSSLMVYVCFVLSCGDWRLLQLMKYIGHKQGNHEVGWLPREAALPLPGEAAPKF